MNGLSIYPGQYFPSVISNTGSVSFNQADCWESILQDLSDKLISPLYCSYSKDRERIKDLIVDFYEDLFDVKGVPSIDDVISCVVSYNEEIVQEIAEVDYANNYATGSISVFEFNQIINNLSAEWYWELYYLHFEGVSELVQEMLDESNMAYFISGENPVYWDMEDSLFIVNDCQNLILQEWITEGLHKFGSDIDLRKTQVVMIG